MTINTDPQAPESHSNSGNPSHPHRKRVWEIVAGVLGLLLIVGFIAAEYVAHHAAPLLRKAVIDSLEQRFHEEVELDSLDVSVIHGLQVEGHGLRLYPATAEHKPVVDIKSFTFFESIADLLHFRERVDTIYVTGMELHVPPHSGHSIAAPHVPHSPIKLVVGKVVCHDALLVIDTDKPGKQPLQFQIDSLTLQDVGASNPFLYDADLINPKPRGRIQAHGHIGPWRADSPRDTFVDGDYIFSNADLNTIKGLGGHLNSTGKFTGALSSLVVDGSTHTPDFSLDTGNHPMQLDTVFHAIVDGTTGDTTLAPVNAKLAHSTFIASGTIVRVPHTNGEPGSIGHQIDLKIDMKQGRIEDLLRLAVKSEPPLMNGGLAMQANVHIPPGPIRVLDKLNLHGTLHISNVEFTSKGVQDKIDGMSMRAQGKPEEAGAASHDHKAEVSSQMMVQFIMDNGMLTVDLLHYDLPGANVQMVGAYALSSKVFNFEGHVRTDAKASEMVTGWKSKLLKPLDGFFEKNGAGLQLPISVSGVNSDYKFGLHDSKQTAEQMATALRTAGH